MELKKAKLQLLSLKKDRESFIQNDKDHDYIFLKDIEAIETVLQELENRIPKKKIKDKIKELRQEALEVHSILIKQTKKEYDYMLYKHYLDLIQQIKGLRKILEETNENT